MLLNGCSEGHKSQQPIWEQVKISDIRRSAESKFSTAQSKMLTEIGFFTFEVPAENFNALAAASDILYTQPLRFDSPEAFKANGFYAGFGRMDMWHNVGDILRSANGKRLKTSSILFFEGQINEISVVNLQNEQTVFYTCPNGSIDGATLEPGTIALRIGAKRVPGSRGVCKMTIQLVYKPKRQRPLSRLTHKTNYVEELPFEAVAFEFKASPGDFVLLKPEEFRSQWTTLGGLFFTEPGSSPAVRTYLLVCRGVND